MEPEFTTQSDGRVAIGLSSEWEWLTQPLEDCFDTLPPAGSRDAVPSTYWIDRALTSIARSDGSEIELASGNMSHFRLAGSKVTVSADYETFDDVDIALWAFSGLLKQWRNAALAAASRSEDAYDDSYPTCGRTHATLRVFSDEIDADAISVLLGCTCTSSYRKGDEISSRRSGTRSTNAWFLGSEGSVESDDLRRHVDWLLDQVCTAEMHSLTHERAARSDIFCYWESKSGHGGPTLEPGQMVRLADLGLTFSLDVYFP